LETASADVVVCQYVPMVVKETLVKQRRSKLDTLLSLFVMQYEEMRDIHLSNIMQVCSLQHQQQNLFD
jgi:hypothetical protein